ncbi:hypothetical protein [uncultured Bacteroides sp.]|uniref:hypothetical protein n=1 Tax=uncultured Bacteroides sp. TaxID=162156 RepID=UPI002622F8CF|nr:hypothetical protein [uncultured Bacteroides sp.]
MKSNIIYSIVVCLAAFALPFMVACSSQEESLPDTTEAALFLNIEPLTQTRSGLAELLVKEKMRNVRVIILHENGTVEHNRYYELESAEETKYILLKVTPNEKKKIFLFANEKSVSAVEGVTVTEGGTTGDQSLTDFFNRYTENSPGFETEINNLYFTPDYSNEKPIPMSSMYEIEVPEKGNVEKTFYVVRVATKFTINFMNWRGEEVIVNKFTLQKHADKNFLMAHVNDSEQNRTLFDGKTWIEWLKEVSDASSEDDTKDTTEAAGWLKDYDLPALADKEKIYTHTEAVTIGKPTVDIDYPDNSKAGVAQSVFYLPESMNLKAGEPVHGEQEYILTLHIKEGEKEKKFICTLPNLKALFRNTHVVVNITLKNSMEIVVDVIPYSEVKLDPIFGLDIKE